MKQKNNNLRSGFVPILIIIAIAIVIAGGVYMVLKNRVAQTPIILNHTLNTQTTPTSSYSMLVDWKHYTNAKYGFSFDYPPDISLTEEDLGPLAVRVFLQSPDKIIISFQATQSIPVRGQGSWNEMLVNPPCKETEQKVGQKEMLALHSTCSLQSGLSPVSDQLAINTNTKLDIDQYSQISTTTQMILASLDGVRDYTIYFTPSPIISTQGWKHYQDAQYGFSFDYPGNFTATVSSNPNPPLLRKMIIDPVYKSFETMTITVRNGSISTSTAEDQFYGYQPEKAKIGKHDVHVLRVGYGDAGTIGVLYVGALPSHKVFEIAMGGDGNAPGDPISDADFLGVLSSLDGITGYESVLAH